MIHDLKNANRASRVSVKLVSEVGVGTIAAGVAKGFADHILISGDGGGTGASPLTSIKHAGLPWELGIAETHQTLVLNDLRSRVVLQTDGGLKDRPRRGDCRAAGGRGIWFLDRTADHPGLHHDAQVPFEHLPGRHRHAGPRAAKEVTKGKPEHVVNYLFMVAEEARELMAELGFPTIDEMVGRVDCLETDEAIKHWKADGLDLTSLLTPIKLPHENVGTYCTQGQDHGLDKSLDITKLVGSRQAGHLEKGDNVRELELPIVNINRTVGTILSNEIAKKWGQEGLPDDTDPFQVQRLGRAEFRCVPVQGRHARTGGRRQRLHRQRLSPAARVIIYPPRDSSFVADENIIVGNVCLYGATGGQAFYRGRAAERFAVRNSGAHTVIEGVGDHGCEYMTGGRVVILGPTGRNFAAGMSGGIAYIWDPKDAFLAHCNLGMVELEKVVEGEDIAELRELIELHQNYTQSTVAADILDRWDETLPQFVKVMPTDYKRVLMERKAKTEEPAVV